MDAAPQLEPIGVSRGVRTIRRCGPDRVLAYWLERLARSSLLPDLRRAWQLRTERSFVRLPPLDGFEAWLVGWPSGSLAPLHDHGPAAGVAAVWSGVLHESLRPATGGAWRERCWQPGEPMQLERGICHEVRNHGSEIALSVHVYEPRLERMTFYDRTSHGDVRPVRVEVSEQW
jgi:predicted metal-dependent enzyme (double-stranded beta helix superfamily)